MYEQEVWLTIKDYAALTGIKDSIVRRGCKTGSIPAKLIGHTYLINPEMVKQSAMEESSKRQEGAAVKKQSNSYARSYYRGVVERKDLSFTDKLGLLGKRVLAIKQA